MTIHLTPPRVLAVLAALANVGILLLATTGCSLYLYRFAASGEG